MSWELLREHLQGTPAARSREFEELVALLLSRLLDQRFVVARSGTQASGDAHSLDGHVAIQAKNYADSSRVNLVSLEGDISRATRSFGPVDVFVVAVSKEDAQLRDATAELESRFGVDIVVLGLRGDGPSDIGALCAAFWPEAKALPIFGGCTQALAAFLAGEHAASDTARRACQLQSEIGHSLRSWVWQQERTRALLDERFGRQPSAKRFGASIRLADAVPRSGLIASLAEWWNRIGSPVMRIEGEEGTGKTWLAACFSDSLSRRDDTAVIWLDSHEWNSCRTVRDVLSRGMARIEMNEEVQKRLIRKALSRWAGSHLLVLDGANERNALQALSDVLRDRFDHEAHYRRVRILVTTRPVQGMNGWAPNLWTGCELLKVGGYDDEELAQAVQQCRAGLSIAELDHLKPLVCLPRYFATCVGLHDQIRSFHTITKELLLWEDLKRKIAESDPTVYDGLGITSTRDAEDVFVKLASEAPIPDQSGLIIHAQLLGEAFGRGYVDIRSDLKDLRFLQDAGRYGATIGPHHVTLAWALWLRRLANPAGSEGATELVDRVFAALEPMPECDLRVEALFVALALTACDEEGMSQATMRLQRQTLLICWAQSQNAMLPAERLEFWAERDFGAYASALESLYNDLYSHEGELALVGALGRVWRACCRGGSLYRSIAERIRFWLLLVFRPDLPVGQEVLTRGGHGLPVAQSPDQLRLAAVAVSLISLRPEREFLQPLALTLATRNESAVMIEGKERHHPVKVMLDRNIGLLMRWGYGSEAIVPLLELGRGTTAEDIVGRGVRHLLWMTGEEDLPEEIADAGEWVKTSRSPTSAGMLRDRGTPLLPPGQSVRLLPGAGAVAVRLDLPSPSAEAIEDLRQLVANAHAAGLPRGTGSGFRIEELNQLRPWAHRLFPEEAVGLDAKLVQWTLTVEHIKRSLLNFPSSASFGATHDPDVGRAIRQRLRALLSVYSKKPGDQVVFEMAHLWEIALFWEPETALWELMVQFWPRKHASLTSIRILKDLAPICVCKLAADRAKQSLRDMAPGGGKAISTDEIMAACEAWEMTLRPPDEDAFGFAFHALASEATLDGCVKTFFALMGAAGIPDGLPRLIGSPEARPFLTRENVRAYFLHRPGRGSITWALADDQFQALAASSFPRDYFGFFAADRPTSVEFREWGDEVMSLAHSLLGQQPFGPEHRGDTVLSLDREGVVVTNPACCSVRTRHISPNVAYWAEEYSEDDAGLEGELSKEHTERKAWLRDKARLRRWDGFPFHEFCAWRKLWEWAETHPDRFAVHANEYLAAMPRSMFGLHHMFTYTLSLLAAMVPTDADRAYRALRSLTNRGQLNAASIEGMFIARLWDPSVASGREHDEVRQRLLSDCRSDDELMAVSLFALGGGGKELLMGLCDTLLAHPEPRRRNMALSMLPWICDREAMGLLAATKEHDTNRWVREHAAWAWETAQQEDGCRTLYREALLSGDRRRMFSALQIVTPALTPAARYWHEAIEAKVADESWQTDRRIRAMLTAFWEHWRHSSGSYQNVEVCGRKLGDYFCGEPLPHPVFQRMAPWWDV